MFDQWVALLGWPAIGLGFLLALAGLVRRIEVPLYLAALGILPMSVYLMGSPHIGWAAFLMPYLVLGAGVALRFRRTALAWLLVATPTAFYAMLAFVVLTAPRPA